MKELLKPYMIYSVSDPRTQIIYYVGQTRDPQQRKACHVRGRTHGLVQKWEKSLLSGDIIPKFAILENSLAKEEVDEKEKYWIQYGKNNGWSLLNIMPGGEGWVEVPDEVRQKISQSMKERWENPDFHAEQIKKMAEALARPEVRAKLSVAARKKKLSVQTKKKISQSVTELWEDPEYRLRQSEIHKISSKKLWQNEDFRKYRKELQNSPEYRAKVSENSKRMWQDSESRAKLVETRIRIGDEIHAKAYPAFYNKITHEIIPAGRNLAKLVRSRDDLEYGLREVKNGNRKSYRGWILLERRNELT